MKNLFTVCCISISLLFVGLACTKETVSKLTGRYQCEIAGEPRPRTSDEFFERAEKHSQMAGDAVNKKVDDCAFAALNESLRLNPQNHKSLTLRGEGYHQQVKHDLALADFNKAIEIEPNYKKAYSARSHIYRAKEMFDKAIADMTKVIELSSENYPYFHTLYSSRAFYYKKNNDYENAAKDYSKAIEFKPDFWVYYADRAKCYRKLGKTNLAEADEKKVKELKEKEES